MRKRLLNNVFKMAEGYSRDYKRMEKDFVESLYDSRVFQKAQDNGKVLCPDCNVSQSSISLKETLRSREGPHRQHFRM